MTVSRLQHQDIRLHARVSLCADVMVHEMDMASNIEVKPPYEIMMDRCGYNDFGDQLCCQIIEALQSCRRPITLLT